MNKAMSLRVGVTAGASLLIHMVVFAAVGPGQEGAMIAGGGSVHFGPPPGGGAGGGPALDEVSMRAPVPDAAEAEAPAPEPAPPEPVKPEPVKPKPVPKPEPQAKLPDTIPSIEPAAPEEVPPQEVAEAPEAVEPLAKTADTGTQMAGAAAAKQAESGDKDATSGDTGPTGDGSNTTGSGGGTTEAADALADAGAQGSGIAGAPDGPGNAASTNYAGLVMQHLSRVRRPRAASPGSAFISFTVGKRGELEDCSISKSSRSARFDRDALKVVQRAAPFPAPPPGVNRTFSVEIEGE